MSRLFVNFVEYEKKMCRLSKYRKKVDADYIAKHYKELLKYKDKPRKVYIYSIFGYIFCKFCNKSCCAINSKCR